MIAVMRHLRSIIAQFYCVSVRVIHELECKICSDVVPTRIGVSVLFCSGRTVLQCAVGKARCDITQRLLQVTVRVVRVVRV